MDVQGSESDGGADKRGGRRNRIYKGGRVIFNQGFSELDCVVRNLSPGGAMLEFESLLGVPSHFTLVIGTGQPQNCRVAWRAGTRMGVSFTDSTPA